MCSGAACAMMWPLVSSVAADINYPIAGCDHLHVMLNNDDCISCSDEAMKLTLETLNIRLDQFDHLASIGLFGRVIADRNIGALAGASAAARPMPKSPPVIRAFRPARRPEPL
jgi:hypothetical protein